MSVYVSTILFIGFLWMMWAAGADRVPRSARAAGGDDGLPSRVLKDKAVAIIAGITLISIGALRWRVGTDYDTYMYSYPLYRDDSASDWSFLSEPGISVIAKLASRVNDDYAVMFAIASIITIGLCVWTIYRNSEQVPLSLLLFILVGAWQSTFNGLRQWLACAVIFAGHRYIIERRFWRFLAVVAVATLFHVSALVLVLAYFIPRHRLGLGGGILLVLAVLIAVQSYESFAQVAEALRDDLDDVANAAYFQEQVNPLRILSALGPLALYLTFTDRDRLSAPGQFYANMAIVHGAVMLASANSAYFARLGIYTTIFLVLAVPALLNMRDQRMRGLLTVVTLGLYCVTWYLDTSYSTYTSSFRWVFQR